MDRKQLHDSIGSGYTLSLPSQPAAQTPSPERQAFAPSVSSSTELESTYTHREVDDLHLQGPGPTPNMRNLPLPGDSPPSSPPPVPSVPQTFRGKMSDIGSSNTSVTASSTPPSSSFPPSSFTTLSAEAKREQLKKLRRNTEDERRFKEVAMQLGLLDTEGEPDLSLNPLPAFVSSSRVDDETEHLDDGAPARASGDTDRFAPHSSSGTKRESEEQGQEGRTSGFEVDLEKGGQPRMSFSQTSGQHPAVPAGLGHVSPDPDDRKVSLQEDASYIAFRRATNDGFDSEDEEKGGRSLDLPRLQIHDRDKTLVSLGGPGRRTPLSPAGLLRSKLTNVFDGNRTSGLIVNTSSDDHEMSQKQQVGEPDTMIPVSSYYVGPPPMDAAFGTDPVGVIGVHHPREILRVERDYSGGEVVQFSSVFPLELEGRITPTEFQETINEINSILIKAYSLTRSFLDHSLAIATVYLSMLVLDSNYDRQMRRLHRFIDDANEQLWNPRGLNLNWPRRAAFMFLEIEYY